MLSWEFPPRLVGGISRHVEGLSNALVQMGNEVHVITLDFPKTPSYEENEGVHIHRVPVETPATDFSSWVFLFNHFFEKRVGNIVNRSGPPDILHIHDWLTVVSGVSLKHLLRRPLIMTFHSTEIMRSSGKRSIGSDMISSLEWWGAYESTSVIGVSKYMKNHVESIFNLPANKVKMIYNGIDLSKFKIKVDKNVIRNKLGINLSDKIILAVGRLTWQKGFDILINSFPKILAEIPQAKLVIIGNGYMRIELENLAQKNEVLDKVIFPGFVSDHELVSYLRSSDVLVIPSRFEPFGMVALEGMCSNIPTVVSGIEGLSEIIRDQVDGLFVDPNNLGSVAQAVLKILKDPVNSQNMVINAMKRVNKFSWKSIAKKTFQTYDKSMEIAKFE
jgi:glycosyltransferase involved in cell wall biosynthesis